MVIEISQEEYETLIDLHIGFEQDYIGEEREDDKKTKIKYMEYLGQKYGFNPKKSAISLTREVVPLPDDWS